MRPPARDQYTALVPVAASAFLAPTTPTPSPPGSTWPPCSGREGAHRRGPRRVRRAPTRHLSTSLAPATPPPSTARANLACWTGEAGDPAVATSTPTSSPTRASSWRRPPRHPHRPRQPGPLDGEAGEPAVARPVSELLADRRAGPGPRPPDTLTARVNLADWQGRRGIRPGRRRSPSCLPPLRARSGPRPPRHPHRPRQPGPLYWEAGDPAVARPVPPARRLERVLGPDHPDTLTARGNLA